ncbi:MAG: hypothetical protein KDA99_04185 [Planctomycetales bacterium]|nr:hypothetical protein [Planctomycetales bacterium]MCA9224776.1 hypothetical protein [Planctomycetales bacterium]
MNTRVMLIFPLCLLLLAGCSNGSRESADESPKTDPATPATVDNPVDDLPKPEPPVVESAPVSPGPDSPVDMPAPTVDKPNNEPIISGRPAGDAGASASEESADSLNAPESPSVFRSLGRALLRGAASASDRDEDAQERPVPPNSTPDE